MVLGADQVTPSSFDRANIVLLMDPGARVRVQTAMSEPSAPPNTRKCWLAEKCGAAMSPLSGMCAM
jgi:hypothetical protein